MPSHDSHYRHGLSESEVSGGTGIPYEASRRMHACICSALSNFAVCNALLAAVLMRVRLRT